MNNHEPQSKFLLKAYFKNCFTPLPFTFTFTFTIKIFVKVIAGESKCLNSLEKNKSQSQTWKLKKKFISKTTFTSFVLLIGKRRVFVDGNLFQKLNLNFGNRKKVRFLNLEFKVQTFLD